MPRSGCSRCFQPRVEINTREFKANLRSSQGLSLTQCDEIKETLRLAKQDIADYTAEIHRKQMELKKLKAYTQQLSSLLSPIRRLPGEILLYIFAFCCEKNDLRYHQPGNALILSSVCTLWRELTVSYPMLWSNFSVQLRPCYEDEKDSDMADELQLNVLVSLYLQRSDQQPLALDIDLDDYLDSEVPNRQHSALQSIIGQSRRWKYLVHRGIAFGEQGNTGFWAMELPLLESVTLAGDDGRELPELGRRLAPKIKQLSLLTLTFDERDIERFSGPWSLLTNLEFNVDGVYWSLWKMLTYCPNIRHLTVWSTDDSLDADPEQSDSILVLPLCSLLILIEGVPETQKDPLGCLLASLTLPRLTKLVLQWKNVPSAAVHTKQFKAIIDFLDRSKCLLTSLTLSGPCLTDKELVTILSRLPSLQELCVEDPLSTHSLNHPMTPISKSFIQSLHAWDRDGIYNLVDPVLPELHSLILKVKGCDFDPFSFVDAVASRWLPHESRTQNDLVCLRSVELHLPGVVDAEPYQALLPFEAAGMQVVVKCPGQNGYLV
ncbi:hypothetical protein GYMLUDRAFT_263378 [Collybiopsis luxurians FD-317 M1]|uniref:Unplaced genomic scaffold GYMLUscaffold_45, whole genome shotgun sequence n=1 Tax=Collybiopsis luxurians FD-317 M1 TaxID=944289 RepID=A0A0D0CP24_9AGAR|nr:hypothetical protein GYMLUDRAFT_263378 [Collybiopsis luxurians FD-317 M1]